jgi:hypothetical protein
LGKPLQNIPKTIWTSSNLENTFTWHTFSSKTFWKNEKTKEGKPIQAFKTIVPFEEEQNLLRGKKLKDK